MARDENTRGAAGFDMEYDTDTRHPAAILNGRLRNISSAAAVDCRISIIPDGMSYENCEIHDLPLSSGIAPGELVPVFRRITTDDITNDRFQDVLGTGRKEYFTYGIDRLFNTICRANEDYPFVLEFRYRNVYGIFFSTAYKMRLVAGHSGKARQEMVFLESGRVQQGIGAA